MMRKLRTVDSTARPKAQAACLHLAQHRFMEAGAAKTHGSMAAVTSSCEETCEMLKIIAGNKHPPARLLMAQILTDSIHIIQDHAQATYHLRRAFRNSQSPAWRSRTGELWLKSPPLPPCRGAENSRQPHRIRRRKHQRNTHGRGDAYPYPEWKRPIRACAWKPPHTASMAACGRPPRVITGARARNVTCRGMRNPGHITATAMIH